MAAAFFFNSPLLRRGVDSLPRREFSSSRRRAASVAELAGAGKKREFRNKRPYFVLIIPATAFGLGCWQVRRREWKLNLIEELDSKMTRTPSLLPYDLNDLQLLEYNKISVRGFFDHSAEVFISPRQELSSFESGVRGGMMSSSSGIGAHVLTPFVLTEGPHEGDRIIVNRGWVPKEKMDPSTRLEGQIAGEVDLVGVVRHSDRNAYLTSNDRTSNVWQSRDVFALAEKMKTTPVFLDADAKSSVQGGPIGGQTRVTLRNEHLSYIVTWFSLAVLTSVLWWFRYVK